MGRRIRRVDPRPGISATQMELRRCRAHSVEPARAASPQASRKESRGNSDSCCLLAATGCS